MKASFRTLLVLVALLTVASFATTFAQDKAKWTGTWKLVPEKSKFIGDGPSSLVLKLELKDGAVTETLVVTSPNGERSFTATYTTDGKAITQQVMGRDAQTSAKWEGDVLVISFSDERGGFARKIALSPDGKTVTIAARQTNENGARDETLILEKQ